MRAEIPARETLFARLLCDVMIPAEFSAAIRTQGYDVAEARTLPVEIQQDDHAILRQQRSNGASSSRATTATFRATSVSYTKHGMPKASNTLPHPCQLFLNSRTAEAKEGFAVA